MRNTTKKSHGKRQPAETPREEAQAQLLQQVLMSKMEDGSCSRAPLPDALLAETQKETHKNHLKSI